MTKARDLGDNAQNTKPKVINAKGDLIVGTGSDAADRLAVSDNGSTLVADSSTSTGLRYQTGVNQNFVINGGFDIWQRGTSFSSNYSTSTYTADRWYTIGTGSIPTYTVSRQTADTTGLQYAFRVGRNSGQTNTGNIYWGTVWETSQSIPVAGKTVTISFYAKKGADGPSTLTYTLYSGTGTDQTPNSLFNGTWTGGAFVVNTTATLTTTMQRFSYTGTVSSSATQMSIGFSYAPSGTAGSNEWVQIEGVQVEFGSVPTVFKRSGGTLAGELQLAQRYYWRGTATNVYGALAAPAIAATTTAAAVLFRAPVTMRTSPSSVEYANLGLNDTNAVTALTNLTITRANPDFVDLTATVAAGLTQYRPYYLVGNNNANAYLGLSAEL
jgi:hypothetical protein